MNGYLKAVILVVLFRLRSEISLPIMRELVPHYLQDSGKVCSVGFSSCFYFFVCGGWLDIIYVNLLIMQLENFSPFLIVFVFFICLFEMVFMILV